MKSLPERFGVTRNFVYEHADELAVRRLGSGPRARLRFDLRDVESRIACLGSRESTPPDAASQAALRRRRRPLTGTTVEVLPIRGARLP
jgi:hypothetical protein